MTEEKTLVTELWQAIRDGRDPGDVERLLDRIEDHRKQGDLSNSESLDLLRMGLRAFQDLTADDPDTAGRVMLARLVPLALESAADDDTDSKIELSNLRELLADWIGQYPDRDRERVREGVIGVVADALKGDQLRPACWTIGGIGYRSPVVLEKLWSIAETDDEHRATALSTIVALGVPPKDRARVLQMIGTSFPGPPPRSLYYTLQELAAPETMDLVFRVIEKTEPQASEDSIDVWLATSLLGRIADHAWRDEELQERLWDRVTQVCREGVFERGAVFDIRYDLARQCNTRRVVRYFLECLAEDLNQADEKKRGGWLVMDRLRDCVRPAQVEGWGGFESEPALVHALKTPACTDTKFKSRFATVESRSKGDAWNHLLSLGTRAAVDWIEEAVSGETSGYVQGEVLNIAACLAVPKLPPSVVRLVRDEYEFRTDGDSEELSARLGAARLARSAATREAFDVLIDFGLTHEGAVFQTSADAIADVSWTLIRSGNSDIVERLFSRALNASRRPHREGAIAGLHRLAITGQLHQDAADPLLRLACDQSLSPYARGLALEAIGFLPFGTLGQEPPSVILDLARGSSGDAIELMWRAVELLVRQGFLGATVHDELLIRPLGLKRLGDGWSLDDVEPLTTWRAHAIGLLNNREPDAFALAAADVLRSADLFSVYPFLRAIVSQQQRIERQHGVSSEIVDALVDRIRSRNTRHTAETELFGVLRYLDSTRLAMERWDRCWADWHPEAMVALADELGEACSDAPQSEADAIRLLVPLMGEGIYAVRRAAYRAMSKVSSEALDSHCVEWSKGSTDDRCRAAEAAGWSSEEGEERNDTAVIARLKVDPEPSVREAATRALSERRDRLWADEYVAKVLAVRGTGNDDVLEAYRYGQALVRLGDDEHERRLKDHLASVDLPPHVQHWLSRLVDQIKKRWQNVTQEWPEPWLSWGAEVEELDGELVLDESKCVEVHFSLWRKMRTTPSGFTEWGGAVRSATQGLPPGLGKSLQVGLRIEGRNEATAVVKWLRLKSSDTGRSVAVLHGSGPYPDKSSKADH